MEANMNEWEAKYKALLAGITDKRMVSTAELLVSKAIDLSASSGVPITEVFDAMMQAIKLASKGD